VEPLRFSTEDGVSLEGELRLPEPDPRGSAVICHAHPRKGGSKDHPLLWAIRNEVVHRRVAVLSFNFRGTMRSGGTFGGGRAEVRDVAAAIGRIREQVPERPTIVCGWSFGANVAFREALEDERVSALALVGIPLGEHGIDVPDLPSVSELRGFRRPVLLVTGEGDQYCSGPDLRSLARKLPNAEVEILPGTDHFFWHREKDAADVIGTFADRILAPS
jgi:alpha/beta superfamily hydrolase